VEEGEDNPVRVGGLVNKLLDPIVHVVFMLCHCPQLFSDVCPKSGYEVERQPVDLVDSGDNGDENEPKPEEKVELLVDNIVWENTDCLGGF